MLGKYLSNLKSKGGLVHNITNYVTVNDVANIILASGASPIMADDISEVEEITAICGGLNINIGTLNQRTIESMFLAGKKAMELNHILVLDPVGVGASNLRTKSAIELKEKIRFDVIRGNISEIKMLFGNNGTTQGVDASLNDAINEENLEEAIKKLKEFSKESKTIIAVTGAIDVVTDGEKAFVIRNGAPQMSRITGTGCQLSGLITAFLVANKEYKLEATAAAVCAMGLAGEIALKNMQSNEGNSTYRNRIIDAIYNMTEEQLNKGANYEIR